MYAINSNWNSGVCKLSTSYIYCRHRCRYSSPFHISYNNYCNSNKIKNFQMHGDSLWEFFGFQRNHSLILGVLFLLTVEGLKWIIVTWLLLSLVVSKHGTHLADSNHPKILSMNFRASRILFINPVSTSCYFNIYWPLQSMNKWTNIRFIRYEILDIHSRRLSIFFIWECSLGQIR